MLAIIIRQNQMAIICRCECISKLCILAQNTICNRNVKCGSLQCQLGNRYPVVVGMDEYYTRTVITIKGTEYECK